MLEKCGRFPHRNAILGRDTTQAEIDYEKEMKDKAEAEKKKKEEEEERERLIKEEDEAAQ